MTSTLAPVPVPTKGSGPIQCSEPQCTGHREKCLFGREHWSWATWYDNGKLMRTENTYQCWDCKGVCTGDEPVLKTMTMTIFERDEDHGSYTDPAGFTYADEDIEVYREQKELTGTELAAMYWEQCARLGGLIRAKAFGPITHAEHQLETLHRFATAIDDEIDEYEEH